MGRLAPELFDTKTIVKKKAGHFFILKSELLINLLFISKSAHLGYLWHLGVRLGKISYL